MTPDYNEILLEAIDTVILQRLSELKLDKTITCTIADASSASDGKYVVTDGSREFDAYCDNTKYREDEQVEVLIPAEGSSTQKTIIGKTNTDKNVTPVAYVSPFERIVQIGVVYGNTSIGKIQANDPEIYKVKVAEFKEELEATAAKCDTLCVEASFKTLMQNYQMQEGNYGLLITLTTDQNESYSAILDNRKDMFGNTYGYSAFTRIEQTFALNFKGVIDKIEVYLYQMQNFKYRKSDEADPQNVLVVPGYYNIQVKDINIGFGYNVEKIADNTAVIDTAGTLDYNNVLKDVDLERHLRLTWYNKDENNQYLGFTDGAFGSLEEAQDPSRSVYHIKWEHDLHNGSWERLNPVEDNILKATEPTAIDDDFWSHWWLGTDFESMLRVREVDNKSFIEMSIDRDQSLGQSELILQGGKYYTLSCELACAKPDNAGGETVQVSIDYGNDILYTETVRLPKANGWVKFSHSVYVPAGYNQGRIWFDSTKDVGFRLYQPKLEACDNATEIDVNVDPIYSENTYRAIIYYKGNVFTSNELVFTAKTGLDSDTVNALNMALTLNNGNKSQDSYPSYGSDSALINIGDASANREVYFTYDSDIGGTLEPDVLNGAQAYFYIPNNATMLNGPYDSENTSWQYAGTDHQIEGYTVYRKVFIDEFTPPIANTEENPISYNLLKNTEPKELNSRPGAFNYSQSIYDWEADDNCYAYAAISRESTGRKKTIHQIRKKDASASAMVIKQRLSGIATNTKYSFSAEIYSRHAARAAVYLLIKDDASGSEQKYLLASIAPLAESWTALQGTLQDSIGSDLSGKSVYLTLESADSEEIFWHKAALKKGPDIPEWFYAEGEEEEKNQLARIFRYRIKEIYNPLATNNKVILKIVDKNGHSYSTWKTFNFSSLGSSGTNYTLIIEDVVNNKAALYDPDHKKLYDTGANRDAFTWYDYPNNTAAEQFVDSERGYAVKKVSTPIDWLGSTITIETLAANFYRRQDNIGYNGPTTIVYDSAGVNPIYYDGEINLFNLETNEKLNNLTYEFKYYSPTDLDIRLANPPSNVEDYPRLVYDAEKTPYPHLAVSKMYLENNDLVVLEIYQNNTLEWRQPLIILQNKYAFSAFNNWDGALKIDSANNMIQSAAMMAGTKRNNQFTGVALGAFSKFNDDTNTYGAAAHGLWGFDAGAQAFGFTADGKAFIGKSGTGRINFNGDSGTITSASWLDDYENQEKIDVAQVSTSGLKIDLPDGRLYMKNTEGNYFSFDEDGLDLKVNQLKLSSGNSVEDEISSQINVTEERINAEIAKTKVSLVFAATCDTAANQKTKTIIIDSAQLNDFPDRYIASVGGYQQDLYPNGTTINVKFTNGINVTEGMILWIQDKDPSNDGGESVKYGSRINFSLSLGAGGSMSFKYDTQARVSETKNENNEITNIIYGAWIPIGYGELSTTITETQSQIEQTSESIITSVEEIKKRAGVFYATCSTGASTTDKNIILDNNDVANFPAISADLFPDGLRLNVKFIYGNSVTENMTLKIINAGINDTNGEAVSGEAYAIIGANESLDFIYDAKYRSESGANGRWVVAGYGNLSTVKSQIQQEADQITLSVQQENGADYLCVSNSAANAQTKEVAIQYPLVSNFSEVKTQGKIIQVKFTQANTFISGSLILKLSDDGSNGQYIYYRGTSVSTTNPLTWDAGTVLRFMWDNGHWSAINAAGVSSLQVNTAGIAADVISRGTDGFGFRVFNDSFQVGAVNGSVLTPTLNITKDLAEFSGKITADEGSIGAWSIGTIGSGWGSSTYTRSLYSVVTRDSTDYLAFLRVPGSAAGNVFSIRTRTNGTVSTPFYITQEGSMYATKGTIGGWTIDNNCLRSGATSDTTDGAVTISNAAFSRTINGKTYDYLRIAVGGKFGVSQSGTLIASDAIITGTVTADEGKIGGWTIGTNTISTLKDSTYTTLKSGGNVALAIGSPSATSTDKAKIQLYHSGRANFGYNGKDYNLTIDTAGNITLKGTITAKSGGNIGGFKVQQVNLSGYNLDSYVTYSGNALTIPSISQGLSNIGVTYPDGSYKLVDVLIMANVNLTPQGIFLQYEAYEQDVAEPIRTWNKFASWKDIVGT